MRQVAWADRTHLRRQHGGDRDGALGADLAHAVQRAKEFVGAAIEAAARVRLGAGPGPLIQIALK